MAEICVSIAAKVAEYLVDPIIRPLRYLFNYRSNIRDLNQQIEKLDLARDRLQRSVDEANIQGDEIIGDVQEWLRYAGGIIQRREAFNEDEKKSSKSCFYLTSRYQLSKQAEKQAAKIVDKIPEAHNFGGRVSYRPPPPPPPPFMYSASFKDYETFQSRESTFNQIMEALRDGDMRMIGVWGMGGVGKTTLVKQVAQQAEKDKLFHKVVMALNISQTPNIAEIQGKIASMLGLTLENNNERAVRLGQSLKKQEKILVILDDIWEKLELGEIGIPYGDDHKGCKVLLTSRERQVLSKDMHTQKEFHLQHLSEDEAWNLFKKTAGDSVEKRELHPIAVDVAKKCEGLPIAIVTIANALRDEMVGVWENALDELRRSAPTNIRGVSKNVYSCLELSYNHLEGNEVKSLFLLCALLGDGDIFMDRLLQYAMGLNLFEGLYSWEKAANKLTALVENLKASSLLLEGEDKGNLIGNASLFFDRGGQNVFVRMHDVVRDVARAIAFKDRHRFVVKEAVGLQEEWQWMDECRNCTGISLKCRNIAGIPQGLVCPKLQFVLLNSRNNDDSYLKIPDAFLQDTKQLRVLDLSGVSLTPSPSSLGFLSNLRTLCLNECVLEDIAVIGELKRLQVLSLANSDIEQLPKEMMQLSDLRVLDLRNCYSLRVIPRNVISSLSRLECLSMEGSFNRWEKEGFNTGERSNACLSELKHLSGLRTLAVNVSDHSLLPEDDVLFDNLDLTRYSIVIGYKQMPIDEYKASRKLMLAGVKSLHRVNCFSKLLKRSQVVGLVGLDDTIHVVNELDKDSFRELKHLRICQSFTIQYILHSTSAEWVPSRNTFCMLEQLGLMHLSNLEAVCHGPIPMGSFGNLRILELKNCARLKYVFSLPTQHGRESAFPQLQRLDLSDLPELISFYSTRSSCNQESVTFFNQQDAFPALESLDVKSLDNVRALWHNQLPADSFSKLKNLGVFSCDKLLNVFPLSVAKALVELVNLQIDSCGVEAIVASEDEDEATHLFLFPKLTSLTLNSLPQLKRFCLGRFTSRLPLLKELSVENCDKVEILFQEIGLEGEFDNKIQQSLFLVEKVAFPTLESLHEASLDNVRALWHNQLPADSFWKLKKLYVNSCNKLLNVFSVFVAKALMQLEDLQIYSCGVEAIVASEDEDEAAHLFLFPKLMSLTLNSLPQLKRFCSGKFTSRWPLLKKLRVVNCDNVEILFQQIGLEGELDNKLQHPLFMVEKEAFPNLEELRLTLKGTVEIWQGQFSSVSLPKLRVLNITKRHGILVGISSNMAQILDNLERLEVTSCDSMNEVIQVERLPSEEFRVDTLPRLKEIYLENLPMLMHLSGLDPYFPSFQILEIHGCRSLIHLVTPSMAKRLVQLKKLIIGNCRMLKEIVRNEEDEPADHKIEFTRLKELTLSHLPNLESFCSVKYTFQFPSLEEMILEVCPKMELFCKGVLTTPRLNYVQENLFSPYERWWEGDLNTTIHKMFVEQERTYMMLMMNEEGSDYESWEAESYFNGEEFNDCTDVDDGVDDEDKDKGEGKYDGTHEDAFDVHAQTDDGEDDVDPTTDFDPTVFSSDEADARAPQHIEEQEMAARLLALAGIHDYGAEDT